MSRLVSKQKIFDAAGLTTAQRRNATVKVRWIKFKHVDDEVPVRTVVYADGSTGDSFIELEDALIEWGEFIKQLKG